MVGLRRKAHSMARRSRSSPVARRGLSANVVITITIVVIAALVIGGILLFNRSGDDDGATGGGGEIPTELRAGSGGNTLTTAPGNRVTLVEFLDFQCPACAGYYENVTKGIERDYTGKITFVVRNFPLDTHPLAQPAARAAEAAANQGKFREMYHALYDNYLEWAVNDDGQQLSDDEPRAIAQFDRYATEIGLDLDRFHADRDSDEVRERVSADKAAGERVGVTSTPTIFVNGERFEPSGGQYSDADRQLREMIDGELG
jgi:protein-disulfide isomerase